MENKLLSIEISTEGVKKLHEQGIDPVEHYKLLVALEVKKIFSEIIMDSQKKKYV